MAGGITVEGDVDGRAEEDSAEGSAEAEVQEEGLEAVSGDSAVEGREGAVLEESGKSRRYYG